MICAKGEIITQSHTHNQPTRLFSKTTDTSLIFFSRKMVILTAKITTSCVIKLIKTSDIECLIYCVPEHVRFVA